MAVKKPLVITNGQIEQLQSTDSIASVVIPQYTNANAGSIVIGTAVYSSAAGSVDKAKADAVGTTNVIGLVADASITASASGGIQADGILNFGSTAAVDAVAGTTGGFTFNTFYYLSAGTAGLLTATAPSTVGQFVVCVGIAVSTTELKINILGRVKL